MTRALEEVLARAASIPPTDLAARLEWLEQAADAAASAKLGADGARAATDLRAALGAIIAFANGPKDPSDLLPLEATVRTFTARALHTLYGALAESYRELGRRGPRATSCRELSRIFVALQKAVASGAPPPRELLEDMRRLSEALDESEREPER